MAVFGTLNGVAVLFALRLFEKSLSSIRPVVRVEEDRWDTVRGELVGQATSPIYWVIVFFWLAFSFYSEFVAGTGWYTVDVTYRQPQLIAVYGYLYQGIAGCLLGGMLMGMLPVNLNIALWKLTTRYEFSDEIITRRGKSLFNGVKNLVILNTLMLVVSTGIAMSLWMRVLPLAPIVGSLAEFIPTVLVPVLLFHFPLARAKESRLGMLGDGFDAIVGKADGASFGEFIKLQGLMREEDIVTEASTWLVDLRALIELVAVTFVHLAITQILAILLRI